MKGNGLALGKAFVVLLLVATGGMITNGCVMLVSNNMWFLAFGGISGCYVPPLSFL